MNNKNKTIIKEKLSVQEIKKIESILKDIWAIPIAQKAAMALRDAGFDTHDLWLYGKTEVARKQQEQWRNNTYNEMRDFDILGKFTDKKYY